MSEIVALYQADEIERLRKELKKYEVITGDEWKARCAYEELEQQREEIKQLKADRDTLNIKVKHLKAKLADRDKIDATPQRAPESEGVNG